MNESASLSAAPVNALDFRGLADIQRRAKNGDPGAVKAAAQQFEALFVQMVLKSMRDATPRENLFGGEQSRMYESLLDQQLTQVLTRGKGIGLAEMLERHMTRQAASPAEGDEAFPLDLPSRAYELRGRAAARAGAVTPSGDFIPPAPTFDAVENVLGAGGTSAQARQFIERVLPDARLAAQQTGIPAAFLIAHAALETGWGRSEPRGADGRPSNNLFGIKAGRGWTGDSVEAVTTEYIQGVPQRRSERFRAYASTADSFRDYAGLLAANPRYADVVGSRDAGRFAQGLQDAGYATDPDYAAKLRRVIGSLPSGLLAAG